MDNKPKIVFRIINKETEKVTGSYSRSYGDEFDFEGVSEARNANFHGMFKDEDKYKINKYKVTYELIEEDCKEV